MMLPPNWEVSLERIARLLAKRNTEKNSMSKKTDMPLASHLPTADTAPANDSPNEASSD
jgi:hypothetical protein